MIADNADDVTVLAVRETVGSMQTTLGVIVVLSAIAALTGIYTNYYNRPRGRVSYGRSSRRRFF